MEFGLSEIILIGFAVFASSLVQGAVGFAVALIAIPLFLQAGLGLGESILVVLLCSLVQNVLGLWQTWKEIEVRQLAPWAILRVSLIPVGYLMMTRMEQLSRQELRQVFGFILILVIILQWAFRIRPKEKRHWGWTALVIFLSGIAQGMIGTPGPPIAFWVMSHDWNSKRARGTMFFLFVTGAIPHLILLLLQMDAEVIQLGVLVSAAAIPLGFLGAFIGLWTGNRFDRKRIRGAIFVTLILLAISLIASPWLGR